MKLILDAMGGDNAPLEIIKGAAAALAEYPDVELLLVGREQEIKDICLREQLELPRCEIIDAAEVISMEDSPRSVVTTKKNSSMTVGLKALAECRGEAFISAGNTGALMTGAYLLIRCIPGIKRGAIATVLPMEKPLLLIDSGSNVTVTPEMLCQFALLGSVYMEKVLGVASPGVGLLNNGTESHKGTPIQTEAYKLLSEEKLINFVGNVEGKEIPFGKCDVLVADGFTGNVVLKTVEGMGKFMMGTLKGMFKKSPLGMISALMIKGELKKLKKTFDAGEYGGAPFLGIAKPVFKAHGSSDAKDIKNAIRQAREYILGGVGAEIEQKIAGCFASVGEEK